MFIIVRRMYSYDLSQQLEWNFRFVIQVHSKSNSIDSQMTERWRKKLLYIQHLELFVNLINFSTEQPACDSSRSPSVKKQIGSSKCASKHSSNPLGFSPNTIFI